MRYRTVDIESYLSSIKEHIRSFGDKTSVAINEQHRKRMIQTIIGYNSKTEFDKALRERKNELEHDKMARFVTEILNPTVRPTENITIQKKAPNYYKGMEFALGCIPSSKGVPRRFSRMASGRTYRGNLTEMVSDVAPELMPQYNEARKPLSEETVTSTLIQSSSVSEQLKDAATQCLQMDLSNDGSSFGGGAQKPGVNCEKQCIEFLKEKKGTKLGGERHLVFENVFVLRTSKPGRLNGSDHRTQWEKDPESAVITTVSDRTGICSEFDGVVVKLPATNEQQGYVTEIWESKTTLDPRSIMDAIVKKLSSVRSLMEEESSVLVYKDGFASITPGCTTTFGIFGTELMPVDKAASKMKNISCHEALGDINVVLEALEMGMIQIDSSVIIEKIVTLRHILQEMRNFNVVVLILVGFEALSAATAKNEKRLSCNQ